MRYKTEILASYIKRYGATKRKERKDGSYQYNTKDIRKMVDMDNVLFMPSETGYVLMIDKSSPQKMTENQLLKYVKNRAKELEEALLKWAKSKKLESRIRIDIMRQIAKPVFQSPYGVQFLVWLLPATAALQWEEAIEILGDKVIPGARWIRKARRTSFEKLTERIMWFNQKFKEFQQKALHKDVKLNIKISSNYQTLLYFINELNTYHAKLVPSSSYDDVAQLTGIADRIVSYAEALISDMEDAIENPHNWKATDSATLRKLMLKSLLTELNRLR